MKNNLAGKEEVQNTEERIYICNRHEEIEAEARCKDCNKFLCMECSIEHNASHKIISIRQEAIKFARSVFSKTLTPSNEENSSKLALAKLAELTESHDELQKVINQVTQKLFCIDNELSHKVGEFNDKANAVNQDLTHLQNTSYGVLREEIKQFANQHDHFSLYQKKREFDRMVANRKELDDAKISLLITQMKKYKRCLNKLMLNLITRVDDPFDQLEDSTKIHHFVGRIEGSIILYDLYKKRKRVFKSKEVKLHECCEGIEVADSIYITGGKEDSKDTYELPLNFSQDFLYIKANMIQGRCNHALCQIKDNFIYAGGGVYGKSTLNKCERYNIELDKWEEIYPLNEAKHNGSMCALNNQYIFFIGGGKIGHTTLFSTIEMLDVISGTGWKILTINSEYWTPCECINAVAISRNEILIFGGWERNKDLRSTCFVYNHASNTMTKVSHEMKKNSAFFYRITPVLYDGKVYAMSPEENIHIFSLKDQEWDLLEANDWKDQVSLEKSEPLIITGRILQVLHIYEINQKYPHSFNPKNYKFVDCSEGIFLNGLIYVIGGENDSKTTIAIDILNYKRNVIMRADLNTGRYNHAIEGLTNGWIYCCGGCAGREMLSSCEKYSVSKNKWLIIPSLQEAKQNISVCAFNQRSLYCIGGGLIGHESLFDTIEVLDLFTEDYGWQILNITKKDGRWRALECVGSAQINPYQIMIFGGWKAGRSETRKCFLFHTETNEITLMEGAKLCTKTGFYYALRPYNDCKKICAMDPGFNINVFDIKTREWTSIRKDEWKDDDNRGAEGCIAF